MKIGNKVFALIVASVLLVAVVATNLQQASAFGFVERQQFKKLTHEFEKNVINAIGNPDTAPGPVVMELLQVYVQDIMRVLPPDPYITTVAAEYDDAVTGEFNPPPDDRKQLVEDFRGLTHDFEKAVIGAINPPRS